MKTTVALLSLLISILSYAGSQRLDKPTTSVAKLETGKSAKLSEANPASQSEASTPAPFDLILRAGQELEEGRPDSAIERYNAVLMMDIPSNIAAEACMGRGNAYRMKGDSGHTMRDYEQAIRLDPTNPLAYMYRGLMLSTSGDHDAAIRDLSEAVRLDPKMYRGFYNRAGDYMATGNWTLAGRDLDEALRLYPKYPLALVRQGKLYAHQGKLEKAYLDYKKQRYWNRRQRQHGQDWLNWRGRYTDAVRNFEKILESKPPQPEVWLDVLARILSTSPAKSVRNGAKAI